MVRVARLLVTDPAVPVASSTDSQLNTTWIATSVSKARRTESHIEFDLGSHRV